MDIFDDLILWWIQSEFEIEFDYNPYDCNSFTLDHVQEYGYIVDLNYLDSYREYKAIYCHEMIDMDNNFNG